MCSAPRAPLLPLLSPGARVIATGRRVGSTPASDNMWTCSVHFMFPHELVCFPSLRLSPVFMPYDGHALLTRAMPAASSTSGLWLAQHFGRFRRVCCVLFTRSPDVLDPPGISCPLIHCRSGWRAASTSSIRGT
ncbi:hypothetical protein CALVIDRAFT_538482 [Calocera viscosa TUFC12733]|uniref:Uncharacterized protein n=1 Tax=Calocera viscosa (strain TUFC12733) TaxID=1330018 RepID=A0A167KU69_CALVF|nr:hypothetical protein CALVIDRAFT_538482 [Calocera viscosa TUFC12733]